MQRVTYQHTTITPFQSQATRVLPGYGTGEDGQAVNDDIYDDKNSLLREVFSILINVVGGTLLLSGMLILPYVIGWILS